MNDLPCAVCFERILGPATTGSIEVRPLEARHPEITPPPGLVIGLRLCPTCGDRLAAAAGGGRRFAVKFDVKPYGRPAARPR